MTVKPGQKLSLQLHHHRSEHWVVVSGTAEVGLNDETTLLRQGESTFVHQESGGKQITGVILLRSSRSDSGNISKRMISSGTKKIMEEDNGMMYLFY